MEEFKMYLEEMIEALDTAGGMLIVAAMRDSAIMNAKELIQRVSLSLGEIEEIKFTNYEEE